MKLTLVDKAFLLKENSMFSSLDLDLLINVAEKMYSHSFAQDQVILHKGEDVHHLYTLARGEIAIEWNSERIYLRPGQYFGDEPLLSQSPASYSVLCTKDCELLTFSRRQLFSIIGECPSIALSLLRIYSSQVPHRSRTPL